jgi:hypothetical protein
VVTILVAPKRTNGHTTIYKNKNRIHLIIDSFIEITKFVMNIAMQMQKDDDHHHCSTSIE